MDRSAHLAPLRDGVRRFSAKTPKRRGLASAKPSRSKLRTLLRCSVMALLLGLISLALFFAHSYYSYARIVEERMARGYLTSRAGIYAAPRTLRRGQKLSAEGLAAALRRAGYVESDEVTEIWNGSFTVADDAIEIRPNSSTSFPSVVRVAFDVRGRIAELSGDDVTIDSFRLAPESLTNDTLTKGAARRQLTFKDIPPVLVQAITSIEDRRFFEHHGLDIFGVARALVRNAGDERIGQGGSSITQQLVKNTYLTPERTFRRKYAEAMLAFSIEQRLSKADIFALYCNEIYLGQRGVLAARGIDQAARVFFGKELQKLSLAEAATIAGMIQSPTRYSPVRHNEDARMRRNTVLGTMARDGHITLEQAAAAAKEPLFIAEFDPARESAAPYFIDYVNRIVGGTGIPPVDHAQDAQATITTLDLDLQHLAAEAIKKQLARLDEIYKPRGLTPQAALVALDPKTGEVLAMVGGRDYTESQLNRATDAQRQPGSVFKPFVYAAALESGFSPLAKFADAPRYFVYDRTVKYRPVNYGGGFSMQDVSMRTGLIKSLNVVTVDVAMQTGVARVANTAQSFGLPRPAPYPAIALGTSEATPLQIAAAYAAFANGGKRIRPQITQADAPPGEQIIQPGTAFMITDMLEGVIDHGTASAARHAIKNTAIAGKTGTSRDGWFVGYTPNLVCAVWIGFDDNKQLGLTGADAALPAWVDFMKAAVDLRPELGGKSFERPDEISMVEVDSETNQLSTGACPQHESVAILSTQAPTSECYRHNVYFALPDDSQIPTLARSVEGKSNKEQPKPPEFVLLRDTEIETDKRGRKVLVNETRVVER